VTGIVHTQEGKKRAQVSHLKIVKTDVTKPTDVNHNEDDDDK